MRNAKESHNKALLDPNLAAEYLKKAMNSDDKQLIRRALLTIADANEVELGQVVVGTNLEGNVTHYDKPTEPVLTPRNDFYSYVQL